MRWPPALATAEESGRFRVGVFAWQAGLATWLLAAANIFEGRFPVSAVGVAGAGLAFALLQWAAGTDRLSPARTKGGRLGETALRVAGAMGIHLAAGACGIVSSGFGPALWFAIAATALAALSGQLIVRTAGAAGETPSREAWRWLALAAAVVWLYAPLYDNRPSGAGDAMWYKFMLADFIMQVRAVGLPVWAGQTEYAFNGAVIPLRLAPGYQHAGALLDLLTARHLEFVALNNALLATTALAGAFSAYGIFRRLVPARATLALLAAFLYIASPAILGPLATGDQYMTFLATPWLPLAAGALWRILTDDVRAYRLLAVALAGLWLVHPPVALCTTFLATVGVAAKWLADRRVPGGATVGAVVLFVVLGSWPFVSALSLGQAGPKADGLSDRVVEFNRDNHPALFLPLRATTAADPAVVASTYQPGWAALALGAAAVVGFLQRRTLAAGIFLLLCGLVAVLVLPVPGVNAFLWHRVPGAVLGVLNAWSVQRFAGVWTVLLLTLGVTALAALSDRRRWNATAMVLLAGAAVWSASQARVLTPQLQLPAARDDIWRSTYEPHNLVLARYSFNGFASVPSYFSHGYIDPLLEHRVRRADGTALASNAESAARHGALPAYPRESDLLARGTWRAVNDNGTDFYNLQPRLALPPRQRLALWVEPLDPGARGWLQIVSRDVFREYILPDSGTGSIGRAAVRGFGTLPESGRVISLYTRERAALPRYINIAPDHQPRHADFDFAKFELWAFDPRELPVVVRAWAPYTLEVRTPEAGFVDTPRAWLPHYRAKVNGRYVPGERSPDGTVMFPVPAGYSEVSVKYVPPWWLEWNYWMAIAGWVALGAVAVTRAWRPPAPATG